MDVDFAPTGREFVSGSYDKTLRIYNADSIKSRWFGFATEYVSE